ncbi:hypothetical protein LINGRAHAP2_LOCUS17141 [Linum grandiflorum]
MPVVKQKAITTDVMKSEEGNDSLDTFIRQAMGKEPLLSFPRTNDNPVQWIQLLQALDQQDGPGWPLLTPLKVQMQKCDKCSREFCSSLNYRRHVRVHHRLKKLDKDTTKNRNLLGAFWEKVTVMSLWRSSEVLLLCFSRFTYESILQLSEDEAKEILSFTDVALEEVSGSSIIKSLMALNRKQGLCPLPQYCLRAGTALLDLIQGRFLYPLSSEELFSILDDASEKTFLCGAAISMQKYIFEGEAAKNGLETKNIVACTSFLVEQKLVMAWLADKDAESLRCQKLLVEEEEAAQRRQAELLERKRLKKLRQKEQRAKEKADVEEEPAELPCSTACSSNSYDMEIQADPFLSSSELMQLADLEECQIGYNNGGRAGDPGRIYYAEGQGNYRRHVMGGGRWPPKNSHVPNGFHGNSNSKPAGRKWSRKNRLEYGWETISKPRVDKSVTSHQQPDDDAKKRQVLIGSISVALGNSSRSKEDSSGQQVPRKNSSTSAHGRSTVVKQWRPVSRNGPKAQTQDEEIASREYSSHGSLPDENLRPSMFQFSHQAAKAFLAERWKEAVAAEHVTLILTPASGTYRNKERRANNETEKGLKLKYIPKQRTSS